MFLPAGSILYPCSAFGLRSGGAVPSAAWSEALAEVEEALAYRGFRLAFNSRLEAAYQAARGAKRNRNVANYLLVYLAAKLLLLFANLKVGSQVFKISMELRLVIVLPLTIFAVWCLRRPAPMWLHGLVAYTPLTVETALVVLLGRLSGSVATERYVLAAGVGIFAQTLLMQVPFRYCVQGTIAALSVFSLLATERWPGHFGPRISTDEIIFVFVFTIPALYERHSRERATRREFLLQEMNRLNTEDILRMNAHLERLSSLDGLTGVFNRRYLDAALARLCKIAVEKRRPISILMIDIDHFKRLNDTAGHQHGDFCLERVAQVLQSGVRAGVDTVARYGGEEFVAILPDADETEALAIGERVREAIEAAGLPAEHGVVTISVGVAVLRGVDDSDLTPEHLIAAADEALYAAKRSGRNRVICSERHQPAA